MEAARADAASAKGATGNSGATRSLMVQGTTSDAGKTTLVAALCRLLARRGMRVAPFKPQNMALNSAVTSDGGEIGRSQALQAAAAGIAPHTDMNPVLLKPNSDRSSQIIVCGKVAATLDARAYHDFKPRALAAALAAHARLAGRFETILIEGAGSPAEINLRERDLANMGFAEAIDCPVILIADIDRGGVFAHLVGTLALLSERERARVLGFVINRFRGDPELLRPGLEWLETHTGKPVLAVLPYVAALALDAEDALSNQRQATMRDRSRFTVVCPMLPRLSNATDLDALRLHEGVAVYDARVPEEAPPADLIVLPGSKSVCADLQWLREQGWEPALARHLRYGGRVLGICGGMQMLGRAVHDPGGLEGPPRSAAGLGWLDFETTLQPAKQLRTVHGHLAPEAVGEAGVPVAGYEIHAGESHGTALGRPALRLADARADGAVSEDGQILATYLHGLFDTPAAADALLAWAGYRGVATSPDRARRREADLDRLADAVAAALDVDTLLARVDAFRSDAGAQR